MKKLRQKLHKLCAKAGQPVPLLAFERWQFNCKLHESLLPAPARGVRRHRRALAVRGTGRPHRLRTAPPPLPPPARPH